MLFNPKLIYESEESLKTSQRFTLYRSWDEYIVCSLTERDAFIEAGYSENPRSFIDEKDDKSATLLAEFKRIGSREVALDSGPKRIRAKRKFIEDEAATEQDSIDSVVKEMK